MKALIFWAAIGFLFLILKQMGISAGLLCWACLLLVAALLFGFLRVVLTGIENEDKELEEDILEEWT